MKIQLKFDLPVSGIHGMKAGRIFEVVALGAGGRRGPRWYVRGDAGEMVGVLDREAEAVDVLENQN